MHTLIVKGTLSQAEKAAEAYGVSLGTIRGAKPHETIIETDSPLVRIARWYTADIGQAPFRPGSLLFYSEVRQCTP